jgi:hypothetical protein
LEVRRAHGRPARTTLAGVGVLTCSAAIALGACGGEERQDENEPKGRYKVEVVDAEFPQDQKLAKNSKLRIAVRNVDSRTIPNVSVTLKGFERRSDAPGLAERKRPVFVINAIRKRLGGLADTRPDAPGHADLALVDTWALGRLRPGQTKVFRWNVTAVQAVPYRLSYTVSAGLDGKARAVTATGERPSGLFIGTIEDAPPDVRVADDGRTIVRGSR